MEGGGDKFLRLWFCFPDGGGLPTLLPFELFLCPWSWAQPQCILATRPDCCLCLSCLPSGVCSPTLHCYNVSWGSEQLRTASETPISVLPLILPPLLSMIHPSSHACLIVKISDIFVCWAGSPLLSYSCPTCNIKGRPRVFSRCHDAYTIQIIFLYMSCTFLIINKFF